MTVKELIEQLKKCDQDKVAVLTTPDMIGWDNIGHVIEAGNIVKITMDGNQLFED